MRDSRERWLKIHRIFGVSFGVGCIGRGRGNEVRITRDGVLSCIHSPPNTLAFNIIKILLAISRWDGNH
jgi:hypothetical protein